MGNSSAIDAPDLEPSVGTFSSSRAVGIEGFDENLRNDESTDEEAVSEMVPTDEDAASELIDDAAPNDIWDLLELVGWTTLAIGLLKVVLYLREVEQEIKNDKVAQEKRQEEEAQNEALRRKAHQLRLFGEPRPLAECPLCMNAMPFDNKKRRYFMCCGKTICMSCHSRAVEAEAKRIRSFNVDLPCPFCRCAEWQETDLDEETVLSERIERSELNGCFDHQAAFELGSYHYNHTYSHPGVLKWWKKAAEHGNELAAYELGLVFTGSERAKFTAREQAKLGKSYMEEAAIAGHPEARYWLGQHEANPELALRHFILAARYGCKKSLGFVVMAYEREAVSKEDLEKILQDHQDATTE